MQIFQTWKKIFVPIHPEGYPFIGVFCFVTLLFTFFSAYLFWFGFIATCWCIFFFRDPLRIVPENDQWVLSPADGVVCCICSMIPPVETGLGSKEMIRVSIFMSVFSCHVNRSPIKGKILHTEYIPGKFINADLDKASDFNERNCFVIENAYAQIGVVQIAGLIARRIVSWKKVGDSVDAGERFGIIRFGSRLDVFIPSDVQLRVAVGQVSVAGETILAEFGKGSEPFPVVRMI